MLICNEFQIEFRLTEATPVVALLHLHPSLQADLIKGDILQVVRVDGDMTELVPYVSYLDSFGNRCARFVAPAGHLRLSNSSLVQQAERLEAEPVQAYQHAVQELPDEVLQFLLPSRYCEVDRFCAIAQDVFGDLSAGWQRAVAIRDWVHDKVRFDYKKARPTKSAMDTFTEREGVCRDFQHLAITLSRCLNLPARYVTGYLGDIRTPYGGPGDFSAWYQVYLEGRWWNMDARHNMPRFGRVLMATGRDASDVAMTTSFGRADLVHFSVESNEVDESGKPVALPVIGEAAPRRTPPVPEEAA